jgi:peroxiredoxin family protein
MMPADLDTIRQVVREEIQLAMKKDPAARNACFIASKGTLDWAYPPLILATAAAAANIDSTIFFTFYGLNTIRKDFDARLRVSPVANPAMPMPVHMPDIVTALPGMTSMATSMMKSMFRKKGVASIGELLDVARESSVRLIACQMTMDLFGYRQEDFIDGVEFGGAAAFLSSSQGPYHAVYLG